MSKRNVIDFFVPYAVGIQDTTSKQGEIILKQRQAVLRENAVINEMKKLVALPDHIKKGSPEHLQYRKDHPENQYEEMINSAAGKITTANTKIYETQLDTTMTEAQKQGILSALINNKELLLNDLQRIWEIVESQMKVKPQQNLIVNEAQAAEDVVFDIAPKNQGPVDVSVPTVTTAPGIT